MSRDTAFLMKKARMLRCCSLEMMHLAGSGHPGGSLSEVELLVALYYDTLRLYEDPRDDRRDLFILSKGHANPPLYAILADKGYLLPEELDTLRKTHSRLQGHPDMHKCPGIDCSTGSLGQGISVAAGMALGLKLKQSDRQVYVLCGDGELDEGIVWEAVAAAAHYRLDNFTLLVDHNRLQLDGPTDEILSMPHLKERFADCGFAVQEIDGHDFTAIFHALDQKAAGQPRCIIADTVKGKGVSFMENNVAWHGKAPNDAELKQALKELEVAAHV